MKKIIYSLVIMIAAGSLFTSCIEQVEPVGLLDMRTAKAEYIRALKDLRAADAEYTRAKAAVEQANARYRDAETAFKNAQVENQKLLNNLQQLWNEAQAQENTRRAAEIAAEIEGIKMTMDSLAAAHAVEMVKQQEALAKAQESLRVVLRDIAIAAKSLSPNEKLAVVEAAAMVAVLTEEQTKALKEVNKAEKELDTLKFQALLANGVWDNGFLKGAEEHWKNKIKAAQAAIVIGEAAKVAVPLLSAQLDEWQDILDKYTEDSIAIAKEIAEQDYVETAYENAIEIPGIKKFNAAIAEFIEENWEQEEDNNKKYIEPALTEDEEDWVENGAPAKTDKDDEGKEKYYSYSGGPAVYVNTKAVYKTDSFPVLTDLKSKIWFNKYAFLLTKQAESYGKVTNPFDDANRKIMAVNPSKNGVYNEGTTPDTLVIQGKVKQDMKDFILGTEAHDSYAAMEYEYETGKTLTASYGLKGAYAVMQRVYTEAKKVYDAGKIDSLIKVTDSTWNAQHDILAAGLAAYEPYTDAIAALNTAATAYKEAKTADAALAKDVAEKALALRDQMQLVVGDTVVKHAPVTATGTYFQSNDTTAIFTALVAYAAARDAYLTQTTAGKDQYDSTLFRYRTGYNESAGKQTWDSVAFSALTLDKLRAALGNNYDGDWTKNVATVSAAVFGNTRTVSDHSVEYYNNGIANIANQLLGENFAAWFQGNANLNGTMEVSTYNENKNELRVIQDTTNFEEQLNAALKTYNIDLVNKKVTLKDGSEYEGTAVKTAKENLTKAEKAVKDAVEGYVAVYNAYWGQNLATTTEGYPTYVKYIAAVEKPEAAATIAEAKKGAEDSLAAIFNAKLMENGKLLADSYTLEYFKPYGDEEIFVTFGEAPSVFNYSNDNWGYEETTMNFPKVDTTQAVLAVLTAIDPFCGNDSDNSYFAGWSNGNILKSAIFFGGNEANKAAKPTTAYKALFWRYMKWVATSEKIEKDMQTIADWIEDIEDIFTTNAARTETRKFEQDTWEADSTAYVKAAARNVVVNAYLAKKKEFVGERIEGTDTIPNDLYLKGVNGNGVATQVNKPMQDSDFALKVDDNKGVTKLFAKNILGDFVGWKDNLGGQQLANAKEFFGEKPYEMFQEWEFATKVNAAKQETLSELKGKAEKVFVERAKLAGLDFTQYEGVEADNDTTIAGLIAARKAYITTIQNEIDKQVKLIEGDGEGADHVKGYAEELAEVQADNITWEYMINGAEIKLAAAKAKLEAITKMLEKAQANLDKIMEYIKSTDAEFVIPVTNDDVNTIVNTLSGFGINLEYMIDYYAAAWGIDIGDVQN